MKSKTKLAIIVIIILSLGVCCLQVGAIVKVKKPGFSKGKTNSKQINIQSKPSTKGTKVGVLKKGVPVNVLYKAGNWYAIRMDSNGLVGYVSAKYLKKVVKKAAAKKSTASAPSQKPSTSTSATLSADEKSILDLVNAERSKNGLAGLTPDAKAMNSARAKAADMVNKNYFAHESPTYGSPFDMMKEFGVTYKTAGENLAGNSDNKAAVNAWMNSPGHRKNILNGSFNYTGIGVVKSPKYGKIYVQQFVGR